MKPFRWTQMWLVLAVLLVGAATASADVTLPAILADHMVVQRGLPLHVWGMGAPGEVVAVTFRAETKSASADMLGRWSVYLSPVEAGGPFSITVKATNTIVLNDVLVGDVWVASGQSNMELPMTRVNNAESEIAAAQYPKIRIFQIKKKTADYPLTDVDAKTWAPCTPETVADSSGVAYFFARNVQQKTGVPIGLIETYWGGTAAEGWTSLRSLAADPALLPVFAARAKDVDAEAEMRLIRSKEAREFQLAVAQAKAEGKSAPWPPYHPDFQAWAPGALFNAMIAPVTPFGIRGVIWYQGEANSGADRAYLYARVFQTLIRDWRAAWGEGDFPFLFVQIANWNTSPEGLWPEVRESQRQALVLKNTAMAVIIDTSDGTDLHPKNKQDVGLRLALAARAMVYGEKIEYSGPLFRQMTTEDHALRLWFDHATGGLVVKGEVLKGFEVAGDDGKFVIADAHIDGTSVVVSSSTILGPVAVRYGWAPNPDCNLYNRDGLPASPFRAAKSRSMPMAFRPTRREFLAGLGALAAAGKPSFGAISLAGSPFRVAVINDEISQDFGHVCEVASRDFGMGWIELRGMWNKNIVALDEKEVAEANRILKRNLLRVTDIASPLFKVDWEGAPKSESSPRTPQFGADYTFAQQEEVLERSLAMAKAFETDRVRCFDFWRLKNQKPYRDAMNEKLRAAAEKAVKKSVTLILENEPACNTATAAEAAKVLAAVKTSALMLNWDPGNAAAQGEKPYPDGYKLLPKERIAHCHCKDAVKRKNGKTDWAPMGGGIIDWVGQFAALKRDGYHYAVSLETHWRGGSDAEASTRKSWAGMKEALQKAGAL